MGVKVLQTNFTSGTIDPLLAAREDLTYYYNGLQEANNLLVMPQGGVQSRPGLQHVRELTPVLAAINLASATVAAPHGGTTGNLTDGSETTYLTTTDQLSTTNPFVVAHIDLGSAQTVTAVDVVNIKLSSGALEDEMFVQYSTDDSSWTNFGTAFDLDASDRSRRRRNPSGAVNARYWRIVRIGATSTAATVSVAEMRFWSETGTLSNARFMPASAGPDQAYMHVLTDRNIDTLVGDDYVGSIYAPHTTDQVSVVNSAQALDTLLLYHKDVQTVKIFHQGDDDEFDFRKLIRTNIPKYDYGAGTGGVDCVQTLNAGGTANGDKFTIELEGVTTTTIAIGSTTTITAGNIQAALRALSNTSATGITVTVGTDGFVVTFGGDDGKRPWLAMKVFVLTGNGVWNTAMTTKGQPPGEDIMSAARGWPRCGVFYQQRLHEGGITQAPNVWLASVVSDYYNFDVDVDDDTKALMFRADTDQVSAIYVIFPGRDLTFFTNDTEFYNTTEPVSDKAVMKLTTRCGSKAGLRVFESDGALIFIQGVLGNDGNEVGTSVREFIFDITTENYQVNLLSKLSANLIKNPVDVGLRKALSTGEADILLMVNADGTATAYTILRTQDVNAFMPCSTRDGDKFLAVGVDKRRRVYFVVERIINGVTRRFIERWNEGLELDGGGIVTITAESYTATDGQTEFTWTFDNPGDAAAIGVRVNGGRLPPSDYAVDLGTKTVTVSALAAGDVVRIARMENTVSGLGHLNGETVQTYVDGTPGDDYAVTGNTLTLAKYADTEIQYGFHFDARGALMPFRVPGQETLSGEILRCARAVLSLYDTEAIQISANGRDWQDVQLLQLDTDILDRSSAELAFTGEKKLIGIKGAAIGAPFKFRRPGPGKFTVRAITREVSA